MTALEARYARVLYILLSGPGGQGCAPGGGQVLLVEGDGAAVSLVATADGKLVLTVHKQGALGPWAITAFAWFVVWDWWSVGRWCGLRSWLWEGARRRVRSWWGLNRLHHGG